MVGFLVRQRTVNVIVVGVHENGLGRKFSTRRRVLAQKGNQQSLKKERRDDVVY
jgi:hypothetical protein